MYPSIVLLLQTSKAIVYTHPIIMNNKVKLDGIRFNKSNHFSGVRKIFIRSNERQAYLIHPVNNRIGYILLIL